jgi:putative restriction endonuclease
VLTAYEPRCAACGFGVCLGRCPPPRTRRTLPAPGRRPGPGEQPRGQCALHHKTFDLGASTLGREGVLLVSDQAHGAAGFKEALFLPGGGLPAELLIAWMTVPPADASPG